MPHYRIAVEDTTYKTYFTTVTATSREAADARAKESVQVLSTVQASQVEPSTPNEGPMARLRDVPVGRPPAGSLATIEF